jgi:hypothetical protein
MTKKIATPDNVRWLLLLVKYLLYPISPRGFCMFHVFWMPIGSHAYWRGLIVSIGSIKSVFCCKNEEMIADYDPHCSWFYPACTGITMLLPHWCRIPKYLLLGHCCWCLTAFSTCIKYLYSSRISSVIIILTFKVRVYWLIRMFPPTEVSSPIRM